MTPEESKSQMFTFRSFILLAALGLIVLLFMIRSLLLSLPERYICVYRATCVSNLKHLSLIFEMYAGENGGRFPPIDAVRNNFIFDGNPLYPEYLTDVYLTRCANDPDIKFEKIGRLVSNEHHRGFETGTVHPDCITDKSYIYLGWIVLSDEEAQNFFEAYDQLRPEDHEKDISVVSGRGNAGGDKFLRLSLGADKELGIPASEIPVMWDRPFTDPARFHHQYHSEQAPIGNVLYLDGHLEFIKYPERFPMTETMARLLDGHPRAPIPDCDEALFPVSLSSTKPDYARAGAVVLAAAVAFMAGLGVSRLKARYGLIGYLAPLTIIIAVAAGRRIPALEFLPPISWLMYGRVEFVALGFACALLGATLLRRISGKRAKVLLSIFFEIAVLYLSVLPFAFPPVLRNYELNLETNFDSHGVCLQSNYFNCGPAAAVTALKAVGISACEGDIAALARTNPASGTQPDILCAALQQAYSQGGLKCKYRRFSSVEELKGATPAIGLIKLNLVTDHHVAILGVTENEVVVGDPLEGRRILSHAEFERIWRHTAIVLRKESIDEQDF